MHPAVEEVVCNNDLMQRIFRSIRDQRTLALVSCVCKGWNTAANSDDFWRVVTLAMPGLTWQEVG